jgi:hypothetical protein
MWEENQNYEYEYRFKKIHEAAMFKLNDPSMLFHNRRPYTLKLEQWENHYKKRRCLKDRITHPSLSQARGGLPTPSGPN